MDLKLEVSKILRRESKSIPGPRMTICKSPKAEEDYLEVRAQKGSGTSDGVEKHVGS